MRRELQTRMEDSQERERGSEAARGGPGKGGDCCQSLHTPTFITGWVVQVKGTGGVVQRWDPLHPGNRPACPPDLLLGS